MNARVQIAFVAALLAHLGLGLWINRTLSSMQSGQPDGELAQLEVSLVAGSPGNAADPSVSSTGMPAAPSEIVPDQPEPPTEAQPEPEMSEPEAVAPPAKTEPEPPVMPEPPPEPESKPPDKPVPLVMQESEPEPELLSEDATEHVKAEPKPPVEPVLEPRPKTSPPKPVARTSSISASRPSKPASSPSSAAAGSPGLGQARQGLGSGRATSRGKNSGPVLISSFDPPYPPALLGKRIGAAVVLELSINSAGAVTSASVALSSGYPEIDRSARETVRQWKFRPALKDGVAIPFRATQRVVFRP